MLSKVLAGALALSLAFAGWQMRRVDALQATLAQKVAHIALLQGNLSDILKDRKRDAEIDNASDDDLFLRACSDGSLQHPGCPQ